MWYSVLGIIFTVSLTWNIVELHELPSYIKPCNRSDVNFHNCVEENVETLKPRLKEGIPELFIPPLDPLVLPPTRVNNDEIVAVTFKDIQIFHADEFSVNQFDTDLVHHRVNLTITFPQLRIKSTYNLNGNIWVLKLDQDGPADGNYTNFKIHFGLKGTPYIKNETEYFSWENETISIEIEKSHVKLENLFGNHTDICDKANEAINENIDSIISDLKPVLQKVIGDFLFSVVNKLFSAYSTKELFAS